MSKGFRPAFFASTLVASSVGLAVVGSLATSLFLNGCGSSSDSFAFSGSGGASNNNPGNNSNSGVITRQISFTDSLGRPLIVEGISGRVLAIAPSETADVAQLTQAIQAAGGAVLLQSGTLYLISVTPGSEGQVILALQNSGKFLSAWPVFLANLATPGQSAGGGLGISSRTLNQVQLKIVDSAVDLDACRGTTHGKAVSSIAGSDGNFQEFKDSVGDGDSEKILDAVNQAARRTLGDGDPRVINVSLAGDKTLSNTPQDVANNTAQGWMNQLADSLHSHNGGFDAPLDNTVVVVAAGNGYQNSGSQGFNLGDTLRKIFDKYPDLRGHLVVVGGTGNPDDCVESDEVNFANPATDSSGQRNFISAPSNQVKVPNSDCLFAGTSAAAPQVSKALRQAIADSNAPVASVVKDFLNANPVLCNPLTGNRRYNGNYNFVSSSNCVGANLTPQSGTMSFIFNSDSSGNNRKGGVFVQFTGTLGAEFLDNPSCVSEGFSAAAFTTPNLNIISDAYILPDGLINPNVPLVGTHTGVNGSSAISTTLSVQFDQDKTHVTGSVVTHVEGPSTHADVTTFTFTATLVP